MSRDGEDDTRPPERTPRKTERCLLWFLRGGRTRFEEFQNEADAVYAARIMLNSRRSDTVDRSANSDIVLIGVQFEDGTQIAADEWDIDDIEPPPDRKRHGEEPDESEPKLVTDPFTGEKVAVWVVPDWLSDGDPTP